ncbi:MAG: signal peptidase I [Candidatus Nealsonbacteria bacterium]
MNKLFLYIWEVLKIVIVALLIVVPIRYFVFQPFFVRGQSMEPNFYNGDYLIVDELTYQFRAPERGEVVVFKYPNDTTQRYIKRIVGLPGETIAVNSGKVFIYQDSSPVALDELTYLPQTTRTQGDIKITLGKEDYFVLGDNRALSADSRAWGTLPERDLIGRVFFRAWPISALAKVELPAYSK